MKPKFLLVLLMAVAIYIAILITGTKTEQRSKALQAELESEFAALPPFSGATKFATSFGRKSGHGIVGASYTTGASLAEIRDYYDSVLLSRGWQFDSERPLRDWGNDLGGYSVRYKKGQFTASLQYAGERARYGWDYGFTISWGLR